jgi:hypothetical protein
MDKLKKYLRDHEVEMEFDVPDDSVWQRIEADIPASPGRKATIRLIRRLAVAATIVGVIIAGAYWWFSRTGDEIVKNNPEIIHENSNQKDSLPGIDTSNYQPSRDVAAVKPTRLVKPEQLLHKEVATISQGYTRLINYKLKELRTTAIHAENPGYFSLFTNRLRKMEKDEQRLKSDLSKYGVTDELLEQLINLYQQKLNVLKSLQAEIKKMNNKVIENKGASKKGSKYYLNI